MAHVYTSYLRFDKPAVDFRVDKLEGGDKPRPYLRLRVVTD
ncbi:hypothetical protein [Neomoorella mulderi]|nr:hypothetical protein [Moorella mulderi]